MVVVKTPKMTKAENLAREESTKEQKGNYILILSVWMSFADKTHTYLNMPKHIHFYPKRHYSPKKLQNGVND